MYSCVTAFGMFVLKMLGGIVSVSMTLCHFSISQLLSPILLLMDRLPQLSLLFPLKLNRQPLDKAQSAGNQSTCVSAMLNWNSN